MDEPSMSYEEDYSEIAHIIQYNHHTRQSVQDQIKEFITLKNDLMENLQTQQIDNNPIVENNRTFFDTHEIESLNEEVTSAKIQLALVGANSCGKTSFLHFLLRSGNFLPTDVGPVTARILRLTYAEADNAVLYVYQSLKDQRIHTQVSLKEYFSDGQEPDWHGMKTRINDHVTRPDPTNVKPHSAEFAAWATFFVEIRIPSPFLKLGIDVYDTPGLLFSDAPILRDNLCQLVKLVKPTLVFMYDNAAITSDSRDCFLALKHALGQLADISMFFLNTKADIERILADADPNELGIDDERLRQILDEERQKRYELLLTVSSIIGEFPAGLPNLIGECSCFDIVSVHSDSDEIGAEMNQKTINRLIQFTTNADLRIARKVSQLVFPMIEAFFDLVLTTNHRSTQQFRKIFIEALQWTENYYDRYRSLMEELLMELYNNILERLDSEGDLIAERAARYPSNTAIENYIKTALQQEIIKVQIVQIRRKYTDGTYLDQLTDPSLLSIAQKNEFLIAAQRKSNWLFESKIKSLDKKSTRQIFAEQTVLAQILLITDILVESNDKERDTPSLSNYKELFGRKSHLGREVTSVDFAKERLREIILWLVNQKTYINEIIDTGYYVEKTELIEKIRQLHRLAEKSLVQREKLYQLVTKYSQSFASIQCKIISILNLAKSNGRIPTIDLSQTLEENVYCDANGLIFKRTSDYLEAHHHLRLIQLRIPNILPLVDLYEDITSDTLWMFFPNYPRKLTEANLTVDNLFEICFDLADTLACLHFHEIVHGDLRMENIFLDENNQCYLASFHYNRQAQFATYDDIRAFGQLGKILYERSMDSDMNVSDEDCANLDDLKNLFVQCLNFDVRICPQAAALAQKIKEIRKNL